MGEARAAGSTAENKRRRAAAASGGAVWQGGRRAGGASPGDQCPLSTRIPAAAAPGSPFEGARLLAPAGSAGAPLRHSSVGQAVQGDR